jgi:hypothetical protein
VLIRWAHSLQIKSARPSPRSIPTMQPQQSPPADACSRIIGIALHSLQIGQERRVKRPTRLSDAYLLSEWELGPYALGATYSCRARSFVSFCPAVRCSSRCTTLLR